MARWEPDARGRLERAAMELWAERGFEDVTTAEIAARAGLAERTFFRHFPDKREVLFGGSEAFEAGILHALAELPADLPPLEQVTTAIASIGTFVGAHREYSVVRWRVISGHPGLRERELIKMSTLAAALADALRNRGVPDPTAELAAEAGIAVFRSAYEAWVVGDGDFPAYVATALAALRAVTA